MNFVQKMGKSFDFNDSYVKKFGVFWLVATIVLTIIAFPMFVGMVILYPIVFAISYSAAEDQAVKEKKTVVQVKKEAEHQFNWLVVVLLFFGIVFLFTPLIFLSPVLIIGFVLIFGFKYIGDKSSKKSV